MAQVPRRIPFRRSGRQRSWREWRAIFASIANRKGIKPGRGRLVSAVLGRERLAREIRTVRAGIRDPHNPNFDSSDLVRLLQQFRMRRKSRGKVPSAPIGRWEKVKSTTATPIQRATREVSEERIRRDLGPVASDILLGRRAREARLSRPPSETPLIPRHRPVGSATGAREPSDLPLIDHLDTYRSFNNWLRRGGRVRRPIARNTVVYRSGNNIVIKLHNTEIVKYSPRGIVELNSGRWQTVTTMERMNRVLPPGWRINGSVNYTFRGTRPRNFRPWRLYGPNGEVYTFFDGMKFNQHTGRLVRRRGN